MRLSTDESGDVLYLNGEELSCSGDDAFSVLGSRVSDVRLQEIPAGVSIRLCDRVKGSLNELYGRSPACTFEHSITGELLGHGETAFFPEEDDAEPAAVAEYLQAAVASGRAALDELSRVGRVSRIRESVYDDIAYLTYTVRLDDQVLAEAEEYMAAVEGRIQEGMDRPLLFICHASEDRVFVDDLVSELDRRLLHGWYDQRELLVGDSIVGRTNTALAEARYLVAVLSKSSVGKPWVKRELNSTLMRQLRDNAVTILPVLIEDCELPPLLADLRYADCRTSFEDGLQQLVEAIRRR
jgi:hypothetical protein